MKKPTLITILFGIFVLTSRALATAPELNPSLTTTIPFPWMDFLGLFLFITGFVIGLGAVTVIDLHAFLGRKSNYWTEATTRTHKVTKPLIWTGLILATIGGSLYYTK